MHLAQQRVQRVGGLLVEVAGRLVGQQQRRPHDQRPRHRDPLLLAARQHARPVRQPLAETDPPQQLLGARPRLGRRHPRDPHRHLGVLERGELRQQVMELEDEADVAVAEARPPRRPAAPSARRRRSTIAAGVGAIEPAEHVQQRALADAGRADNRHHLAGLDRQVEIAQHGQRRAADRCSS